MIENNTLLTEQEDLENLNKFVSYRNNLMYSIGIDNFINKMREIIDQSEYFEFRSLKSRTYINKERPIFILKIKNDYNKKFEGKNFSDTKVADEITSEITELLQKSIIDRMSEFIINHINTNEELKKIFESFDSTLKNLCATNIFGIRNSIMDNMIYLEYFK